MSNKDIIGQHIICYDAVERVSKLLDQMCEGLANLGVLKVIRAFPDLFVHLFTYTASVSCPDVIDSIDFGQNLGPSDHVIVTHLKRFLGQLSEEGMYPWTDL